jgi:hypothetical protein
MISFVDKRVVVFDDIRMVQRLKKTDLRAHMNQRIGREMLTSFKHLSRAFSSIISTEIRLRATVGKMNQSDFVRGSKPIFPSLIRLARYTTANFPRPMGFKIS